MTVGFFLLIFRGLLHFMLTEGSRHQIDQDSAYFTCQLHSNALLGLLEWPYRTNCSAFLRPGTPVAMSQCNETQEHVAELAHAVIIRNGVDELLDKSSKLFLFTVFEVVNNSVCMRRQFSVMKSFQTHKSCSEQIIADIRNDVNVFNTSALFSSQVTLPCFPPGYQIDDVLFPPISSYSITWKSNIVLKDSGKGIIEFNQGQLCRKYGTTTRITSESKSIPAYKIYRVTNSYAGVHSCEIEYNGSTAYSSHHLLCIQREPSFLPTTVRCSGPGPFVSGDEVEIACTVTTSNGNVNASDLEIHWVKLLEGDRNRSMCSNVNLTNIALSSSFPDKASCGIKNFINDPLKCFLYIPHFSEIDGQDERKLFKIFMLVRNTARSDAGTYAVRVRFRNSWSDMEKIRLVFDNRQMLFRIVVALFAVLGFLLFLTLVAFFTWYYRIRIQLFIRRHFGKFDEDSKEYVASLSYYFSSDLSTEEQKRTKTIACWTRELLKDLDYQFYDTHQHYQPGYHPEHILSTMVKSHRLILIMTKSFIEDCKSRFVAQQGYLNMLQNETKLIIISTPSTMKSLNRSVRKGETFSKDIMEAVKVCRAIKWKENMSESRFKEAVQYALPYFERTSKGKS